MDSRFRGNDNSVARSLRFGRDDPDEIVKDTSHGAGNEETNSEYAEGIRVKQYLSRRQHKRTPVASNGVKRN